MVPSNKHKNCRVSKKADGNAVLPNAVVQQHVSSPVKEKENEITEEEEETEREECEEEEEEQIDNLRPPAKKLKATQSVNEILKATQSVNEIIGDAEQKGGLMKPEDLEKVKILNYSKKLYRNVKFLNMHDMKYATPVCNKILKDLRVPEDCKVNYWEKYTKHLVRALHAQRSNATSSLKTAWLGK